MKYVGSIIGFQPKNYTSIYTIITNDSVDTWKANVIAEVTDKSINVEFSWNGNSFKLQLWESKKWYYQGRIIYNKEPGGTCFFWLYKNDQGLILRGDFIEIDAGQYDCFLDLREI